MYLQPWDPLPRRPTRVLLVGASGSGKTTLGRRIAAQLGAPYIEMDALFHGPDWQPRASFIDDAARLTEQSSWVTDYQYGSVLDLLGDRADLVVWLDLPRPVVLRRILERTVRRRIRREVLWNDNREPPLHRILIDPEHVVRWSWHTYPAVRSRVRSLAAAHPDLPVVRLTRTWHARRWLGGPLRDAAASR